MSALRDRLHEELQNLSEGYRNLPPTEQTRQLDDGLAEFLETHFEQVRDHIRARLTRLPKPPGADDSWSW